MKKHILKFRVFSDNDYEKRLISKKLNNGDWDYWLVIQLRYLEEYLSEEDCKDTGKYEVSLLAVSPEAAGEKNLKSAFEFCGDSSNENTTDTIKIQSLLDYGVYAALFYSTGNNSKKLLCTALDKADVANVMFGFLMDRPENRVGNTGWDFISGNIGFK